MREYKVNALAALVPLAGDREQEALVNDIQENGQNEPAVLWKNEIVDGRCRQLACKTLGIELKVRHLDKDLDEQEVAKIVKSLNTRRNLTATQKLMSAVLEQDRNKKTNAVIAKEWAVGLTSLKNAKYVKNNRPDLVEPLFNGESITLPDPSHGDRKVTTIKVNTIARLIKLDKERDVIEDTSELIEFNADSVLKTEAGKNWYYSLVTSRGVEDTVIRMLLAELANFRFKE